ncbi:MAG: Smr/MutS family protein, partial [Bacteroidia bacterium]|nr:Smr/MutS family protein [Bacteroidia bacterium]
QSIKKSKPHNRNLVMEIDLHIDELVDDTRGMSNLQIITIQTKAFQNALELAISKKYHKLIVIHGVGNGVLKNEICKIIKNVYELPYADASLAMYGKGATQIFVS